MAVFNRQSMKRVRWIKGPTKRDRSRFAVLTEPIGSGSRNPGDRAPVFAMQNREPPGLPANETGAHTPYASFSIAGLAFLVAPRHMATSDYLDMQMIRRARERVGKRGGRRIERDASPSLFSIDQCELRVQVCVCVCVSWKGCLPPFSLPVRANPPSSLLWKNPPRYARRGGSSLLATVRNLHVDALFDARLRIGWS